MQFCDIKSAREKRFKSCRKILRAILSTEKVNTNEFVQKRLVLMASYIMYWLKSNSDLCACDGSCLRSTGYVKNLPRLYRSTGSTRVLRKADCSDRCVHCVIDCFSCSGKFSFVVWWSNGDWSAGKVVKIIKLHSDQILTMLRKEARWKGRYQAMFVWIPVLTFIRF